VLLLFAGIYLGISGQDPAAFSERLDHVGALYLSTMVATTIGFGDIAARSDGARIALMLQMVADVVVLGVAAKIALAAMRAPGVPAGRDRDPN
jgi:hypothetical protein